jgi:uncharacterized membrane protein
MTSQKQHTIVNIITSVLIMLVYALIIYQRHMNGHFDLTQDYSKWGIIFLVFIAVSIGVRIVIHIIFNIINAIATRKEDIPVEDERDKIIKLKSTRNAHYTFSIGFAISIILMSVGFTPVFLFVAFFACCLLSDIMDNVSQFYYHRKGI